MKIIPVAVLLVLAGCQAAPAPLPSPMVPPARLPVQSIQPVPDRTLERKVRQQAQLVDALMSQNEALQAQLQTAQEKRPALIAQVPGEMPPAPLPVQASQKDEGVIAPNADGLIDLTAPLTTGEAEANPFAVRKVAPESAREVVLQVSGIVTGAKPCAVINDRVTEPGGGVEGFTVVRIEPEAVILQWEQQRLRLALSDKPVRVRLTP